MKTDETRITSAIALIETRIEALLQANLALVNRVNQLTQDNAKLKDKAESAISKLDGYIIELEDIRKHYGSSNNNN